MNAIYSIPIKLPDGSILDWSAYQNTVILLVNTASECGLKGQLADLETLYAQYKSQGFEIIAFPSSDFRGQEPRNGTDIAQHCSLTYKTTYPFAEKGHVRKAPLLPIYEFLTQKSQNGKFQGKPWWNFEKFIINKQGLVVHKFKPWVKPTSKKIQRAIEALL